MAEKNWANYIQDLRHACNLPLSDDDIRQMTLEQWKAFVKTVIWDEAFTQLMAKCKGNKKTMHLTCHSIKRAEYLVRIFDIDFNYKNKCSTDLSRPFCKIEMKLLIIMPATGCRKFSSMNILQHCSCDFVQNLQLATCATSQF